MYLFTSPGKQISRAAIFKYILNMYMKWINCWFITCGNEYLPHPQKKKPPKTISYWIIELDLNSMKTSTQDWGRLCIFPFVFFVLNVISTLCSTWDIWISLSYEMPNRSISLHSLAAMIQKTTALSSFLQSFYFLPQFLIFSSLLTDETTFWFLIGRQV